MPNRIFMTGASGNVGSAILQGLVDGEYEIRALVRNSVPLHPRCQPIFGDLSKLDIASHEIAAADAIIHCASPRSQSRRDVLDCEIEGMANLINGWSAGPLVYMSSQTVYGVPKGKLSEASPIVPTCWYDIGKITNEYQLAMADRIRLRGAGISLRLPVLFGSGARRRNGQFLPCVLDVLRNDHAFLCASLESLETNGTVYIGEKDLGRAVINAMRIRESGPYNIAGGFTTWRRLIDTLAEIAGLRPKYVVRASTIPGEGEFRLPHSRSEYDCSKFQSRTGFQPNERLEDILARFVAAEGIGR